MDFRNGNPLFGKIKFLLISLWCSILELVRTHFAACGGEGAPPPAWPKPLRRGESPRKFGRAVPARRGFGGQAGGRTADNFPPEADLPQGRQVFLWRHSIQEFAKRIQTYYLKNLGINQNEKGLRVERVHWEPFDCESCSRRSLSVKSVNAVERQENDLTADRHREHDRYLGSGVVDITSLASRVQPTEEEARRSEAKMQLCQDDEDIGENVEPTDSFRPNRRIEAQRLNPHSRLHRMEQNKENKECQDVEIALSTLDRRCAVVKTKDERSYRHLPSEGKPADELSEPFHFGLPLLMWFGMCYRATMTRFLIVRILTYMSLKVKLIRKSPYFRAFSGFLYWIKKFSSPKIKIWFPPSLKLRTGKRADVFLRVLLRF